MTIEHAPATMATQHPDNARPPAWLSEGQGFVDTKHEAEECFKSFADLGCREYMWDWEGKHVDEAVVERLLEKHHSYFKRRQLGKDVFLTFRVPNVWVEKGYRIARAFASIISANDFARSAGVHSPPVFECILPLTTSGRQPFLLRKQYAAIAKAFGGKDIAKAFELAKVGPEDIRVIPLIEHPEDLVKTGKILREYARQCKATRLPLEAVRVFIARSDPALNNGLVAATVAAKAALGECAAFEEKTSVRTLPIIGVGCLPFRGGLTPHNAKWFAKQHAGVRTFTLQSAFRYDYEEKDVKKAIAILNKKGAGKPGRQMDSKTALEIVSVCSSPYRKTIEQIAGEINAAAAFLPQRRERKLHIGLFGYARSVNGKALPRAIGFTGGLYSLGIPPELIGTGRGLAQARGKDVEAGLEELWPLLREYLVTAGNYLNRENLAALAAKKKAWREVLADVKLLDDALGEKLGPTEEEHFIHRNLTSSIYMLLRKKQNPAKEIVAAAEVRRSLG